MKRIEGNHDELDILVFQITFAAAAFKIGFCSSFLRKPFQPRHKI